VVSAPSVSAAGKVALVTGGARGIGAAIADGLRAIGATVAVLGRLSDSTRGEPVVVSWLSPTM
jgi:NAD(P)-dependent dehydrogenase (short-subunit alcohol dehydrogenase family)